jgi:hypothetical protein
MNTTQAYINGFVKRAMEHGYSQKEAVDILNKLAAPVAFKKPAPVAPGKPAPIKPGQGDLNDAAASKGKYTPPPLKPVKGQEAYY